MNKSLILAALLVPSFGYAITEEEQIEQLENQARETRCRITQLNESLAYEAFLSFMAGTKDEAAAKPIVKELRKLQKQLARISKQLEKMGVRYEDSKENCCCPETCKDCCKDTK